MWKIDESERMVNTTLAQTLETSKHTHTEKTLHFSFQPTTLEFPFKRPKLRHRVKDALLNAKAV